MNSNDIKTHIILLFVSWRLIRNNNKIDQQAETKLFKSLFDDVSFFLNISKNFRENYGNLIQPSAAFPLYMTALGLENEEYRFKNLWTPNGLIVFVDPGIRTKSGFTISKDSKKAVRVKSIDITRDNQFWNFNAGDVDENLIKGVVYDSTTTSLIVSNDDAFLGWLKGLFTKLNSNQSALPNDRESIVLGAISKLLEIVYKNLDSSTRQEIVRLSAQQSMQNVTTTSSPNSLIQNANAGFTKSSFKIFYGPPGTGKTREARKVVGNNKEKFKIIQIHPSSSYEDIIEGIKPVTFPNGDVKYEVQDGPIKIMAKKAEGKWVSTLVNIRSFNDNESNFVLLNFPIGTISKWFQRDEKFSIQIPTITGMQLIATDQQAKSDTIKIDIITEDDRSLWKSLGLKFDKNTEVEELFCQIGFRGNSWGQGNYVVVLDEMNRGSVASILGELVFAISETRGTHADKKAVCLQYSHEEFTWPQNLSLYGTMNSTDVSLDRIDQAIKRRFDFHVVAPDPNVLKINDLEQGLDTYLLRLNKTIEKDATDAGAYNVKDKLIGHSFFIPLREAIVSKTTDERNKFMGTELKKLWDTQIMQGLLSIFNGSRDELDKFIKEKLAEFAPSEKSKTIFGWQYIEEQQSTEHLKSVANG